MTSAVREELLFCQGLDGSFTEKSRVLFDRFQTKKKLEKDLNGNLEVGKTKTKTKELGPFEFRTKIVWFNAIGFLLMHLAGLYGLGLSIRDLSKGHVATFTWMAFLVFLGGEGITIGAHRLWTHKSFKASLPLQVMLIAMQTLAGQNCCYIWARDHRQHHKYSDTDADPHNAGRGFFFSHIGWLMMKKHPDVISKGKGVDMSDLEANAVVMFQKKYYKPLYILIAMMIPVFTPVYFWNEILWKSVFINFFCRYILLLNITWCVNSVAHMFGTRPYDKNILPVESYFVSFIGLGEGWHNYHHAFPWDYKASEFGMNLNTTTRIIEFFAKIGWAYDLREVNNAVMESRIKRCGDGSHPVYGSVQNSVGTEKDVTSGTATKNSNT
ncbi:hypothetical protein RUM44_010313 [Polyplax serrata]|uniref:Fatty acid desaturase domain-containing protein n=1 Tax=Polyplax serrata TaxID=468196 RepID=A0ABR1AV68_POLSC